MFNGGVDKQGLLMMGLLVINRFFKSKLALSYWCPWNSLIYNNTNAGFLSAPPDFNTVL